MMIEDILPVIVMVVGFGIVGLMGVGLFRFMKSSLKGSDFMKAKITRYLIISWSRISEIKNEK